MWGDVGDVGDFVAGKPPSREDIFSFSALTVLTTSTCTDSVCPLSFHCAAPDSSGTAIFTPMGCWCCAANSDSVISLARLAGGASL